MRKIGRIVARLSFSCQDGRMQTSKTIKTASVKHLANKNTKAKPKTYHHGNLRESLLLAAETVLAERGVHGISLRDVAKLAGVSHAAPYHHFASLNDLLAALAERGFVALGDAMAVAAEVKETRERLLQIGLAYVNCARARPAQFRLMFSPFLTHGDQYPAMKAASERSFALLLAAACAHDPANGPELALCGWSLSHGLGNLLIDGAFDKLPFAMPATDILVRQLISRALTGSLSV